MFWTHYNLTEALTLHTNTVHIYNGNELMWFSLQFSWAF
jgi:hypothetical protein